MKRTSFYSFEHRVLAQLLRKLRLKKQVSQMDAGNALGRPQAYISAIETFIRGVDLVQLRELVRFYGVPLRDFVDMYEDDLASTSGLPERELRFDAKPRTTPRAAKRPPSKKKAAKASAPAKTVPRKRTA